MVEFMNEHYAHSNLMYAKVYGQLWQATEARMVGLDKAGMELDVTVPTEHSASASRLRIVCKMKARRNRPWLRCLSTHATYWRNRRAKTARASGVGESPTGEKRFICTLPRCEPIFPQPSEVCSDRARRSRACRTRG